MKKRFAGRSAMRQHRSTAQELAHLCACLEELALRGAGGDSEHRTDLFVRVSFHVVQDEHVSHPERQLLERRLDALAQQRLVDGR